jgi:hypothetical protein
MIATGVTDKPSVARSAVEETMTASPDAEWGEVVRIAVTGWPARGVELSEWPPQGVVYICSRTTKEGEYEWLPCFIIGDVISNAKGDTPRTSDDDAASLSTSSRAHMGH